MNTIKETKPTEWTHESEERFTDTMLTRAKVPLPFSGFAPFRDFTVGVANGLIKPVLDVADTGCGAGTQSFLWAEIGDQVHDLDINQPLLEVTQGRASELRC